jgi:uncharacterized protein YfaS (alpha-2-macroglobulin family)
MLWASAYGGFIMGVAKKHGFEIPGTEFDSLISFLAKALRNVNMEPPALSDACLALYALAVAGHAEPAYHEKFYGLRHEFSPENRALLALAIAESQGPSDMVAELLNDAPRASTRANSDFGCEAREQAIRLLAWIHHRPQDAMLDRLVGSLMREQSRGHWSTTQGDAWALLALAEYARQVEGKLQPADGQLAWAGETTPFHLDGNTMVFTRTVAFTNAGAAPLKILNPGHSRLYAGVSIEARPAETPQPRQDRGFSLERLYERLDDENQAHSLKGFQVGDRVLISLRLKVRDHARYVVIDDALPSSFEAINPELKNQEARPAGAGNDDEWWPSDFREIRKDRCLSFANWVPKGSYTLRYVARVRAAGTVTAPSAKVEEMYHPERCGLSGSELITTVAAE